MDATVARRECAANRDRMVRSEHCFAPNGPEHVGGRPDMYVCERNAGHAGEHAWLNDVELVRWPNGNRRISSILAEPVCTNDANGGHARCQLIAGHAGPHRNAFTEWANGPAFPRMPFDEAIAALTADGGLESIGTWRTVAPILRAARKA